MRNSFHLAFPAKDIESTRDFYEHKIGYKVEDLPTSGGRALEFNSL